MGERFLIIDDSPYDRELIKRAIKNDFSKASYIEVIHQQAFEDALRTLDYSVVFLDYQLKWSTGTELLKIIRARSSTLPVIMVTDTGSEEIAAEAMKEGLNDYVLKRHLQRLPFAVKDCLERARLREAQIQQAQRLENLGLLASGIAHDFNSVFALINGFAQLGMRRAQQEASPFQEYFQDIHRNTAQGARMTQQLLAFARGMPMELKCLNLNKQISALLNPLQTLVGVNVQLAFHAGPNLRPVYADETQLEQMLINLCLNARDAMPMGGNLELTTEQIEITPDAQHSNSDLRPGSYALVQVKDTGIGMDEQTQAHLFEPFFTTKKEDEGTGLGLAVVYSVVKQYRGIIQVQSQPGQGTTFSLYFPTAEPEAEMVIEQAILDDSVIERGGDETFLLVKGDPGQVMREVQ